MIRPAYVPTLVLSQRYSPDSNALFAAALAAGWDIERLHSFRCPEGLAARDPVFYGETILADAIVEAATRRACWLCCGARQCR